MGGERVAHPVRVRQQPPEGARVQAPASRGQEECSLGASRQFGAGLVEVTRQPVRGLFPERDQPLFAALAAHVNELLLEVDVTQIQVDGFATAEAGRVDELAEGAVSQAERALAIQSGKL